ncbi:YceI family protein [Candidatus Sumerlaeota bacterium]|nr:YceI family protein [Candidatus Sumerlaeota bacterium]
MKSLSYLFAGVLISVSSTLAFAHGTGTAHTHDDAKAAASAATAPGKITWHGTKDNGGHVGTFKSWKFTKVDIPDGDLTKGTVELEIDLASLDTTPGKLVEHLKSSDFFDVAKYGTAKVTISNAKPAADKDGKKSYDADAKVDMRGATSTVKANFVVESEKPLTVKGTAVLDRAPYKMEYDTKKPGAVHMPVEITIEAAIPEKVKAGAAKDEEKKKEKKEAKPQASSGAPPAAATPVSNGKTSYDSHGGHSH